MDGMWCMPRGRSDRGAVSLMCWGWAFCTKASGVCLVSLKALTSPSLHLHLHSSAGPLRCCSPHSTITLPLLNIYGSQETRSQHQLFYSHTFFNRLGSSFHNFVFHGFLGEIWDFFKVFTAYQTSAALWVYRWSHSATLWSWLLFTADDYWNYSWEL